MDIEKINPFKNQDYYALKSKYNHNNLFEDDLFPASKSSLFYSKDPPEDITWLRPHQATKNPEFVIDGYNRSDLDQGKLNNCWFIAACAGICESPKVLSKVIPSDQGFEDEYCGMFHFRFYLYGQWVDVVIDDRLPFKNDGSLLFCSNKRNPDEFWAPLLEKAYAKLYGSYESLNWGHISDGLVDMSGGLPEKFSIKKLEPSEIDNFWFILSRSFEMNSIMGCSIKGDGSNKEKKLPNGLVRKHSYTITKLASANETKLVRIRNPWGNKNEWNGPWSDKSPEWNQLSESERADLGFVLENDGEFWMSYEDFLKEWDSVEICHLTANSFGEEILDGELYLFLQGSRVEMLHLSFRMEKGETAGGDGTFDKGKYWTNPQIMLDLNGSNESESIDIIISLMQKDSRIKKMKSVKTAEESIQFKLFKIKDSLNHAEIKANKSKLYANQLELFGDSGPGVVAREISKRFNVKQGIYLIVPNTINEDRDCEFMLRIYSEQTVDGSHLNNSRDDLTDDETFLFTTETVICNPVEDTQEISEEIYKDNINENAF